MVVPVYFSTNSAGRAPFLTHLDVIFIIPSLKDISEEITVKGLWDRRLLLETVLNILGYIIHNFEYPR